jgi:predicted transcriptional regulator
MKESTLKMLDDEKFVAILQSLGMHRNIAILIAYLANAGEATSKDIVAAAGLCKSEVNMKIQDLRNENWISAREVKRVGKGRSPMVYSLAMPIVDIIKRLEDEKLKESAEAIENVQKLKDLASS